MRSFRSAWVRGRRGWLRATGATAAVEMHSVGVHDDGEAARHGRRDTMYAGG